MRHEITFSDAETRCYTVASIYAKRFPDIANWVWRHYLSFYSTKGPNVMSSADYKAGRTPQHNPGLIGYDGHTFNLGVYRTVFIKRHHMEFVNKSTHQKVELKASALGAWVVKVQSKSPPGEMLVVMRTNDVTAALKVIGINEVFTERKPL